MPIEHSEAIPIEQPAKLKGRAKLLGGLQRISSSPSLVQLGRRRASSNPYNGRSALSCVSLATPSSPRVFDNSYGSNSYCSTAASTPGLDAPFVDGQQMAVRKVEFGISPGSTPTSALPLDMRPMSRSGLSPFPEYPDLPEIQEDYFSFQFAPPKRRVRRVNFNFWGEMPHEIALSIFSYLTPKQIVRASIVSKEFHKMCFDGQLWTCFDATDFYKEIPANSLAKILVAAGPFVKDLNLRGCVQVEHYKRAEVVAKACKNLINATLEGCRNFQRSALHNLLKSNGRLANLNLTGLPMVTNGTCKIIAESCPSLEVFNVSWCTHMDARGIKKIIEGCPKLIDLRAGEVRGFGNHDLAQLIFDTNTLQKLVLPGCADITDEALRIMVTGESPEIDILTDLPIVPVRNLRHLDLSRCTRLTSVGINNLTDLVPALTALQLSGCPALTDDALSTLLTSTPLLTHLDLEDLTELTNTLLTDTLAKAPCAPLLQHLSLSYCEKLGDTGLLPVIRACTSLRSAMLDNTRISDLTLTEAAQMLRTRSPPPSPSTTSTSYRHPRPHIGLNLTVYDCQNVTWTGIREVLSRNAEIRPLPRSAPPSATARQTQPREIIALRCFYGWQPTVDEHAARVLRGDLGAAARLERKWAGWMMANEEAGAMGAGGRRRRRRAREAAAAHADEEEGGVGAGGVGRRRRARSSGCAIM
jgi:F-box/leucine-rich repeat protein 2/20